MKIEDNHRVMVENFLIDVTLFEGIDDFYVHPINVIDKRRVKEIEEEKVDEEQLPEVIEELGEVSDNVVYDPIGEEVEATVIEVGEFSNEISEQSQTQLLELSEQEYEESKTEEMLIKSKSKPMFNCDKCKKEYRVLASLDMHRWKRHKIPLPDGPKKKFRKFQENFGDNDIYFGLDLTKTCQYCFHACIDSDALKLHLDTIHKEIPRKYTCKTCQKLFKTRETLRMHFLAAHTDARREFKCQHCDKMFFYKRSLQRHEEIQHLGIKGTFICDVCGQKSNTKGDLNRHKLRHDKIKAHACPHPECGKR